MYYTQRIDKRQYVFSYDYYFFVLSYNTELIENSVNKCYDIYITIERKVICMKEYNNIEKVSTLDNGTITVMMKNGREAIVEIVKFNEKFQAAIYRLFTPELGGTIKKESTLAKLGKHDIYKECAKEALGWIDDNSLEFIKPQELKEFK